MRKKNQATGNSSRKETRQADRAARKESRRGPKAINITKLDSNPARSLTLEPGSNPIATPIDPLAARGETTRSKPDLANIFSTVGDIANFAKDIIPKIKGRGDDEEEMPSGGGNAPIAPMQQEQKWYQKTNNIIGMAVGGAVVVGGIIYFASRKKA